MTIISSVRWDEAAASPIAAFALQEPLVIDEILNGIARSIIRRPQELSIIMRDENDVLNFSIQVADSDLGSIQGLQGRTARAIRSIASACGRKVNRRVTVSFASARGRL